MGAWDWGMLDLGGVVGSMIYGCEVRLFWERE